MAWTDKKTRTRDDYPFILDYRTRCFDSVVNAYLMRHCHVHPPTSRQYPLVVHTSTDYFSPIAYPAVAEVGLRVVKLGRSSVTFELGLFESGLPGVKAVCDFVHVFVERATGRPVVGGMGDEVRAGLERLLPRGKVRSRL
ncbi:hypothetical protein E4U21_004633 [Claviceps maximensis]|nr:hypothetical protein E4U21_004633 [Claviceps maximensis]